MNKNKLIKRLKLIRKTSILKSIRKTRKLIKKYNTKLEFDLHNNVLWFALQPSNKINSRDLMKKLEQIWGWLEENE